MGLHIKFLTNFGILIEQKFYKQDINYEKRHSSTIQRRIISRYFS